MVRPEVDRLPPAGSAHADVNAPVVPEEPDVQFPLGALPATRQREYVDLSKIATAYSFSRIQLAFWSLIVILSFIHIWSVTNDFNCLNTTALTLLGVSFATSAAGSLVGNGQASAALSSLKQLMLPGAAGAAGGLAGEVLKSPEKSLRAFLESRQTDNNWLRDILSDNQGPSIHRLQAVSFNVLYGIIFMKSVVLDYTIPTFEETELMLLGLSNGTYAFLKSSETK